MTATMSRRTVADLPRDPRPGPHHKIAPLADILSDTTVSCDRIGDMETLKDVLREKRHDSGYKALVESIREHGLGYGCAPAIEWYDYSDEPYWFVSEGHHRIAAMIDLGAQWIAYQYDETGSGTFVAPDGSKPAYTAHSLSPW